MHSTTISKGHHSRRRGAVVLAALITISACGSDDNDAAPATTAADTTTTEAAVTTTEAPPADAFPVTITDQWGDVVIPAKPERVVTSGNFETDIALQLGVVPVAMAEWSTVEGGVPPWRIPLLPAEAPPQIVYAVDGYDIEETISYDPDLVLNMYLSDTEHRTLNETVPALAPSYLSTMDELVTMVGQALGLNDEAAALNAQRADAIAEARAAHPQFDGLTIALGYSYEDGMVANYTDPGTVGFLQSVGFTPLPTLDNDSYESFSLEQISQFDADVLFIQYSSPALQAIIEGSELFQRLEVVTSGRYIGTSEPGYFDLLRPGSPAATFYSIDEVLPEFAARIDATS